MKHLLILFLLASTVCYSQVDPINIGTSANDRTGDPLRTAFEKVNDNDAYLDSRVDSLVDDIATIDTLAVQRLDSLITAGVGGGDSWPLSGNGEITGDVNIEGASGTNLMIGGESSESDFSSVRMYNEGSTVFSLRTFPATAPTTYSGVFGSAGVLSFGAVDPTNGNIWLRSNVLTNTLTFEDARGTKKGVEYGADYSAGFTNRSLIDKGFGDSNYWKISGTTSLIDDVLINLGEVGVTGNTVISMSETNGFSSEYYSSDLSSIVTFGVGPTSVAMTSGSKAMSLESASALTYGGDYSANFTDRSLIDKGFANSNYWKTDGTTTLPDDGSGDITIQGGFFETLTFADLAEIAITGGPNFTVAGNTIAFTGSAFTYDGSDVLTENYLVPTASTGTSIRFDIPRTYGYTTAVTGNITLNVADLLEGTTQLLIHNDSVEPTFGAEFKIINGEYIINVDNYIMFYAVKSNLILVTISQEL